MKEYTFILSFGCLTSDDKLSDFKFFLDEKNISYGINSSVGVLQIIFNRISDIEYKTVKKYFYENLFISETLYDINDIMFMSFDNYEEDKTNDKI